MNKNKKIRAFTLVEVLITILVLAILTTITFLSYNNYSSTARDSSRILDVANITSWINSYLTNWWALPMPEWVVSSWTINWKEVAYKWLFWDNIAKLAWLQKTPTDPLNKQYYIYWVSSDLKYYQVWVTLENWNISFEKNLIIQDIYWANNQGISKVKGNYVWNLLFSTWGKNYITNIPSLIFNFSWSTNSWWNLLDWNNTYFVIDWNTNLPYKLDENTKINNKDWQVILQDLTKNSGSTLLAIDITNYTNWTTDISNIFSWSTLNNFWYSLDSIKKITQKSTSSQSVITYTNCYVWNYSNSWSQTYNLPTNLSNWDSYTWVINSPIANWTNNYTAKLSCINWTVVVNSENVIHNCNSGYTWDWSWCNVASQTVSCTWLPANASWNTVSSITQNWNWTSWVPNNVWSYNTTSSTTSCNYICSSWATRNWSSCTYYANCNAIKTAIPASSDWTYRIKPDSNPAFQVYCDMTTDWWGWTLVVWIYQANKNHFNTSAVNPWNLSSITWYWKFSDATINIIKTWVIRFTCWSQTRYYRNACTFAATTLGSWWCTKWSSTYNWSEIQSSTVDWMYWIHAWYDGNSIIYATLYTWSYPVTLNWWCASYTTAAYWKVWVK